jgi:hypothetical protein
MFFLFGLASAREKACEAATPAGGMPALADLVPGAANPRAVHDEPPFPSAYLNCRDEVKEQI